MNAEQKSKLGMLREALLRAESKAAKEKYETDPHFRSVVDRGVKKIIERCDKERAVTT